MNEFAQNLFQQLEALVATGDAFYRQEFVRDGKVYWIYNYRLASYSEFMRVGGMECRGHMFEVEKQGDHYVMVRLASLPMPKCFNLGENPSVMNLNLEEVVEVQDKMDGSLISSYAHGDGFGLKSKGSLFSEQAVRAEYLLNNDPRYAKLKDAIQRYAPAFTFNMELIGPNNRVVIGYPEEALVLLNVRAHADGNFRSDLNAFYDMLSDFWVKRIPISGPEAKTFVSNISNMTENIEGFIVYLRDGTAVKVKTDQYVALHHTKDSVMNPRRLFECVLREAADDLKGMFATDVGAIRLIEDMEAKVANIYNPMVAEIEKFHGENKHLDRKDYAIKAQAEVTRLYFGLAMSKYLGQTIDFKNFLIGKWKELGVRDTVTSVVE